MADISFPARITVDRQQDLDGLPILNANVTVSEEAAKLALPAGPVGTPGRKGRPRTTFQKMGEIPDAEARPVGLGPDDRGKWWHRLDDDGMDTWTGTTWRHSPNAVGGQGEVATANMITDVETVHKPELVNAAVEFVGTGAEQQLKVTVPAGLPGARGSAGASGEISGSPDFDQTTAPMHGGVFAFNRASQKFRPLPAPMGVGPWSWYQEDFAADQQIAAAQLIAGTFTVPAQPFAWRPIVYGHISSFSENNNSQSAKPTVRLHHAQGASVAIGPGSSGTYFFTSLLPAYRDGQVTKTLSPSSTFATVPAGQAANLVVTIDRSGDGNLTIGYKRARASLVVYAQPI
ncbi:hypothetical protein NONI108955_36420 [Nocardia ninae]|uniref:Minor tail protein n=1 Tax=Nocardia ninae NBRC 108245 TaxID=1210091 RepID=A0A511MFQ8_9NOCA|nr:hypothetical protein [Nocardia ninae]GEM39510.1 hypothetical protein NN4_40290 [Nocardia ninae NBRC 108245]